MKLLALAIVLFAAGVSAKCPNACSGHGTCGEHDMCVCYRNWQSADCSERVCPYHLSFVTTPQGDLNMDGDLMDGNVRRQSSMNDYSDPTPDAAATAQYQLISIGSPHGTWEAWPAFATAGSDEGHFYMECSNRGLCDRKTGECECFDGYEGRACARTVCPEGCNGHGTCESVSELATAAGLSYSLWDADKSFSCKCDPGYTGPSCSSRQCPFGDDPLVTTTYESKYSVAQKNEIQFLDIVPDLAQSIATTSYLTLTYTDVFGETWNTTGIQLSSTAATTATNVKNALKAIPNKVFEDVSVTALSALENFIDGTVTGSGNADGVIACANVAGSTSCNIKAAVMDDLHADYSPIGGWNAAKTVSATTYDQTLSALTSDIAAAFDATQTYATTAGDTVPTNVVRSINGQRIAIEFTQNPGDLTNLACQVDNTASAATAYCRVTTRLPLCHAQLDYDSGNWHHKTLGTCNLAQATSLTTYLKAGARLTATGNAVAASATLSSATATNAPTAVLYDDGEAYLPFYNAWQAGNNELYTQGASAGDWVWVGTITSDCVAPDAGTGCDAQDGDLTSTACLADTDVTGDACTFTPGVSTAGSINLAANAPAVFPQDDVVAVISSGISLMRQCGNNDVTFHTTAAAGASLTALHTVDHQDLRGCSPTTTKTADEAVDSRPLPGKFTLNTDGTTERLECGRRGLCDSATGICACFKGYTLDDCSLQSVLAS